MHSFIYFLICRNLATGILYVMEVVYESVEVKLNLSEYDQDLRNGTMYSGNILKMIIFGAIYSGTA